MLTGGVQRTAHAGVAHDAAPLTTDGRRLASDLESPVVTTLAYPAPSTSHEPGTLPSPLTFTSLLVLPRLLQRRQMSIPVRSSTTTIGGFIGRNLETAGAGARRLVSSIIDRHSPPAADEAARVSAPVNRFLQRQSAESPMANASAVPAPTWLAASPDSGRETHSGWSESRGSSSPSTTPGRPIFVFRKPGAFANASPGHAFTTNAPAIQRADDDGAVESAAAHLSASDTRSASGLATSGHHDASSAQSKKPADLDELVERVSRRLTRQLAIEHERRGAPTWR